MGHAPGAMRAVEKRSRRAGRARLRLAKITKSMNSATAARSAIDLVRKVDDLLECFNIPCQLPGTTFDSVHLSEQQGLSKGDALVDWMLSCVKELQSSYEQSRMGWDEAEKLREICHPQQRVIIACIAENHPPLESDSKTDVHYSDREGGSDSCDVENCGNTISPGEHVGFLSFRWVVDEKRPAMYVYELYVVPRARKRGLATALMRLGEQICAAARIPWVLLTVFDANVSALALYRKLRYDIKTDFPFYFIRGSHCVAAIFFNSDKEWHHN